MRHLGVVAALAIVGAGSLAAQSTGATLKGLVRTADGVGLEGASVEILGTRFKQTTRAAGAYRFDDVPAGRYWIAVRRIGYSPLRITITLADADRRNLAFEMDHLPVNLSELKVIAQGGMSSERYQDFWSRAHSAFGKFLTRDDITSAPGGDLISLVQQHLPGKSRLALEQRLEFAGASPASLAGGYYVVDDGSHRSAGQSLTTLTDPDCTPLLSINGGSPSPGISLADFDRDALEAIEIYRRGKWVPTEFTLRATSGCGLVVLWLR